MLNVRPLFAARQIEQMKACLYRCERKPAPAAGSAIMVFASNFDAALVATDVCFFARPVISATVQGFYRELDPAFQATPRRHQPG
jgi:hypothetical protein